MPAAPDRTPTAGAGHRLREFRKAYPTRSAIERIIAWTATPASGLF